MKATLTTLLTVLALFFTGCGKEDPAPDSSPASTHSEDDGHDHGEAGHDDHDGDDHAGHDH